MATRSLMEDALRLAAGNEASRLLTASLPHWPIADPAPMITADKTFARKMEGHAIVVLDMEAALAAAASLTVSPPCRRAMNASRSKRVHVLPRSFRSAPWSFGRAFLGSLRRSSGENVVGDQKPDPVQRLGCRGLLLQARHVTHFVELGEGGAHQILA